MTITVLPARNELTANAGQTIFNYTFKIFSVTDLNVYITPAGQEANDSTDLTTAFTVLGVGDEDGGTITLTTGANLNDLITIVSNIPSLRTTDYQNNGDFRPDTVNADFDRVVSLVKKIEDSTNRSLLSAQSKQGPKPLSLPEPVVGKLVKWKSDLTGLENTDVSQLSPGLITDDQALFSFSTLSVALASTDTVLLKVGRLLKLKEHTTGSGGGATWEVFAAGTFPVSSTIFDVFDHDSLPLQLKLRPDTILTNRQMGAIGNNIANDTLANTAFTQFCIDNLQRGLFKAGTYKTDLGVMIFDNGHISTPFPIIETEGSDAVIFTNIADIDAPFMEFTNGTAVSGVGKFWEGGKLGGMSFNRTVGSSVKPLQHGVLLRGFRNTEFGLMEGQALGGDTINIEPLLFGGNNPDPYQVSACVFDGATGIGNGGGSFINENFVGLNGCTIGRVSGTNNVGGIFFGMGAGNSMDVITGGACSGFLIGDNTAATGGASSRFILGAFECDDVEFGIEAGRITDSDFGLGRFVHRFQNNPLNPAGGYWPEKAVNIASTSAQNVDFSVTHRIEAGGTKPDLGVFVDYNNAGGNATNITVTQTVIDNAGLGIVDTDEFSNFNANTTAKQTTNAGVVIIDTLGDNSTLARAPASYQVPNGGFPNVVGFSTELKDQSGNYDPVTFAHTARVTKIHTVSASFTLSVNIGTRVRIGTEVAGSVVNTVNKWAPVTGLNTFDYQFKGLVTKGQEIKLVADNNSGGAVNVTIDNYFFVEPV